MPPRAARQRHSPLPSPSTIVGNPNTPGAWEWIAGKIDRLLPVRFKKIDMLVRRVLHGRARRLTTRQDLGAKMARAGLAAPDGPPGTRIFEGASLFAAP